MRREVGIKRETRVRLSSADAFTSAASSSISTAAAAAAEVLALLLRRCDENSRASAMFSCGVIQGLV